MYLTSTGERQCMELPSRVKWLLLSLHPLCLRQLYKPKEQFLYDDTDIVYYIYDYICYSHIPSDCDISLQERNFKTDFSLSLLPSTAENSSGGPYSPGTFLTATANPGQHSHVSPRELVERSV